MARNDVITAVFASPREAEDARVRLLAAGIPERNIMLSTNLTTDSLAGEYPGQTYSNQPGQEAGQDCDDALADTAHIGGCVIHVELGSDEDRDAAARIVRECGGRRPAAEH